MLVCLHISRQKAQKANLQLLWGQAKPAAMQIYQSGWQGSSQTLGLLEESLHVLRRIQNHEEDFAGGSPVLRGLVSLSFAACSPSPLVRTAITSTACYEEWVCDHTTRKRQFGMLLFRQHCVNSGNWTMGWERKALAQWEAMGNTA